MSRCTTRGGVALQLCPLCGVPNRGEFLFLHPHALHFAPHTPTTARHMHTPPTGRYAEARRCRCRVLGDLHDAALAAAIAEQEALAASNPAMAKYLAASLEQHKVERARRSTTTTTSTSMVVAGEAGPAPASFALARLGCQHARVLRVLGRGVERGPRGDRAPPQGGRGSVHQAAPRAACASPSAGRSGTASRRQRRKTRSRTSTPAERKNKRRKDAFYVQLKENDKIIKEAAREHACPLLCQQQGLPWPPTVR